MYSEVPATLDSLVSTDTWLDDSNECSVWPWFAWSPQSTQDNSPGQASVCVHTNPEFPRTEVLGLLRVTVITGQVYPDGPWVQPRTAAHAETQADPLDIAETARHHFILKDTSKQSQDTNVCLSIRIKPDGFLLRLLPSLTDITRSTGENPKS